MDVELHSPAIALDAPRAAQLVEALGGLAETSRLTFTPVSTVFAWGKSGMSQARFDHVRLAASARGKAEELSAVLQSMFADEPRLPFDTEAPPP